MSTSRAAIVRQRIKTILNGLSYLPTDRVKLFEDLAETGYFVKIGPAVQTHYSHAENYSEFSIEVVFYFPIPSKADFDFLDVEDIAFHDIRNALGLSTNYSNSAPPKDIEVEGPETTLDISAPSGLYKFKLEFFGD